MRDSERVLVIIKAPLSIVFLCLRFGEIFRPSSVGLGAIFGDSAGAAPCADGA